MTRKVLGHRETCDRARPCPERGGGPETRSNRGGRRSWISSGLTTPSLVRRDRQAVSGLTAAASSASSLDVGAVLAFRSTHTRRPPFGYRPREAACSRRSSRIAGDQNGLLSGSDVGHVVEQDARVRGGIARGEPDPPRLASASTRHAPGSRASRPFAAVVIDGERQEVVLQLGQPKILARPDEAPPRTGCWRPMPVPRNRPLRPDHAAGCRSFRAGASETGFRHSLLEVRSPDGPGGSRRPPEDPARPGWCEAAQGDRPGRCRALQDLRRGDRPGADQHIAARPHRHRPAPPYR